MDSSKDQTAQLPQSPKSWLPVICLAFAAFIFNTAEFIPIGLLTNIAKDFHMTESRAGIMITIYAWAVAVLSLPLILVFARMESRKLLGVVFFLFVASNIGSYFSNSFALLMVSRLGVACAHAVFWAIASPLAVRIAPPGKQSAALGIIATGTSLAMILGLPLGRTIGLYLGWRTTFLSIAVIALLVMIVLLWDLPKLPSKNASPLRSLPSLFHNRALIEVYLLTAMAITGHFCAYSYIEPFLANIARFSEHLSTFVLLLFGLTGIFGSLLFSRYNDAHPTMFTFLPVASMFVVLLLLYPLSFNVFSLNALCMVWGISIAIFNLAFQYKIIQLAPQNTDVAMAIYSAIYNIGIGGGAFIGGLVGTHWGLQEIGFVGGGITLLALVYGLWILKPQLTQLLDKRTL
ncbi:sugar transporter [Olivibacter sitiensis]|uniref:sugar transporter n=1 Tax=Olivibacter sitiensis TaxID=376470 RepID=UPI00041AF001|nr:sugar transporter [Olivibacter sitiensis]